MSYISSKVLSEKWGISQRRIVRLAQDGRIEGAKLYGTNWMFPNDAEKPLDGRTKDGRIEKQTKDSFRFPSYEFRDIASFNPPLCKEELILKEATEEYYAFRIEKADMLLGDLPETAQDRYIRIAALYTGCMVDIYLCNTGRFLERYGKLRTELEEEFPHKIEMSEFLHMVDSTLCNSNYYSNEFRVIPGYRYHESFLPKLANLCAASFSYADRKAKVSDLKTTELNCIFLENSGAYADLQSIHLYLGVAYGMIDVYSEADFHFAKALELAEKYEMYYPVAVQCYYTRNLFNEALKGFSRQFRSRLIQLSDDIRNHYLPFAYDIAACSIFKLLTHHEFIFIFYAKQGLTNREIVQRMNISESTVANRFSSIYAALNVHGKREMIALYRNAIGEGKHSPLNQSILRNI